MPPLKVMVTGVHGLIAGAVYQRLQEEPKRYEVHAMARRRQPSERVPAGRTLHLPRDRFTLVDLTDLEGLERAFQGMEVVVHMAADARHDGSWESILASNVVGARNAFEAAHRAGVRRVVFASSIMVSWGYQQDEPYRSIAERRFEDLVEEEVHTVTHEWPVRPTGLYPASKVWGEALGRYYADVHHLSVLCLRIGWVNGDDHPRSGPSMAPIWCSQRDIVQLVERAIHAPEEVRYDIFYGCSSNRWCWVDIEHARQVLGYIPQDTADDRMIPG
jgi:nucleoside-diphosphate-sugar epimerase